MKDTYHKLVRDKIPEIIRQQGDTPITELLDGENYFLALNKKLAEEVAEYMEDYSIDELADIAEVVFSLVKYKGVSAEDFEQIRLKKRCENGGFDNRIALIEVERNYT